MPPAGAGPAQPPVPGAPAPAGAPQPAGDPTPAGAPKPAGAPQPAGAPTPAASLPTRDELTKAWGDTVLPALPGRVKAYLSPGRFVAVEDHAAVFALPDPGLLQRAGGVRSDAEAALGAHFARPVPLRLVLDDGSIPARADGPAGEPDDPADDPTGYDLDALDDAGPGVRSPAQRLLEAFPGAEEVPQ